MNVPFPRLTRSVLVLLASAFLLTTLSSAGSPPVVEAHGLTPTFGGMLLAASFTPHGKDALTGAWFDGGHAKLLACKPHCMVVKSIPLDSPTIIGQESLYRVVLAGDFRNVGRVKVVLRFEDMQLVTVSVPISSATAWISE
ncbi:hypothetical protein [Deinococcus ruber]|uniref:Uncharacterized protein n=1 Tax=Deinococcus ruber TaxID=1848197 RepID=A0A918C1A8_9DEIO|nr:hypothetical protein [Deinococcus ruber]GGR00021.1 hypothetical protein GCM10008957_10870 [Deinococcus ruber]